jgi:hypothetical protein
MDFREGKFIMIPIVTQTEKIISNLLPGQALGNPLGKVVKKYLINLCQAVILQLLVGLHII